MLALSALTSGRSAIAMKDQPVVSPDDQQSRLSTTAATSSVSASSATVQQSTAEASTAGSRNGRDRDSSWLELEACREHLRQTCPRAAEECRYAHPEPGIYVKEGRVTCCYDFLKDRCYRERCRYFHPPIHIKERLIMAGKQFGAMMSNLHIAPGCVPSSYPTNSLPQINSPAAVPLISPVIYGPDGRILSAAPPGFIPGPPYGSETEQIDICPFFAQGKCINQMCPLVHPEPHVRLNLDSTVTVCRDFMRGGCSREKCRYFHPPGDVLSQMEHGAMPALMQQGIMVASPVMPVYPPFMYPIPGPVTSLSSPLASGVPLYPSVPVPTAVPVPVVLTSPPPPPVDMTRQHDHTPISTITSMMQVASKHSISEVSALPPIQSIIMAPVPYQH